MRKHDKKAHWFAFIVFALAIGLALSCSSDQPVQTVTSMGSINPQGDTPVINSEWAYDPIWLPLSNGEYFTYRCKGFDTSGTEILDTIRTAYIDSITYVADGTDTLYVWANQDYSSLPPLYKNYDFRFKMWLNERTVLGDFDNDDTQGDRDQIYMVPLACYPRFWIDDELAGVQWEYTGEYGCYSFDYLGNGVIEYNHMTTDGYDNVDVTGRTHTDFEDIDSYIYEFDWDFEVGR